MTRPDEHLDAARGDSARPSDPRQTPGGKEERGGRIAIVLALPGVFLSVVFFPLGLALDVAAIVLGARALRRVKRNQGVHGKAPGAIPGIVIGAVGAVLATIMITLLAFFWTEVRAYQECMSGANTLSSQETCMTKFEHAIQDRLGLRTIS